MILTFTLAGNILFLMADALLFSFIECYICADLSNTDSKKLKEEAQSAITHHGGMVRDYIDDDINLVISIQQPYEKILRLDSRVAQIHVVHISWLWNSLQQHILLPYVCL